MENTVNINEIEEIETIEQDVVNTPEESNNTALIAGMIGGFLAYGIVSGARKLVKIVGTKTAKRKARRELKNGAVDADYIEVENKQESDEDTEN